MEATEFGVRSNMKSTIRLFIENYIVQLIAHLFKDKDKDFPSVKWNNKEDEKKHPFPIWILQFLGITGSSDGVFKGYNTPILDFGTRWLHAKSDKYPKWLRESLEKDRILISLAKKKAKEASNSNL